MKKKITIIIDEGNDRSDDEYLRTDIQTFIEDELGLDVVSVQVEGTE